MAATTALLAAAETQRKHRGHRFFAPQAEQRKVPALYATENDGPLDTRPLLLHYFSGGWDWYVAEMNTDTGLCFGLVINHGEREWGYFCLPELEAVRPRSSANGFSWLIERDCFFDATTASAVTG